MSRTPCGPEKSTLVSFGPCFVHGGKVMRFGGSGSVSKRTQMRSLFGLLRNRVTLGGKDGGP